MTKFRVAAAAVALAAAVTVASGCARPTETQTLAGAAPAGEQVLADIVGKLYGATGHREAGQERQFYAWQAAMGACMVGKGQPFGLPSFTPISQSGSKIGPGDILAFAPQRDTFGIGDRTVQAARVGGQDNPALLKLSGDQADAWLKAQGECEPATKATEELAYPAIMAGPTGSLQDKLAAIQQELAPNLDAMWKSCMVDAGHQVEDLSDVSGLVGKKYPPVTFEQASDPTRLPGWGEAVAFERAVAAADWRCRSAESTRVINASGEQLTAWQAAHAAELDAVAAAWAQMPALRDTAKAAALKLATVK